MTEQPTPESWDQFRNELEKQAQQQAAKWIVAGVVALTLFAGTGWWFYLQPKIDEYIAGAASGLPSGAVVAFLSSESQTCPGEEWTLFEEARGRFILGAGHNRDAGLRFRALRETGGEEHVTLFESHIASHEHTVQLTTGQSGGHGHGYLTGTRGSGGDAGYGHGAETSRSSSVEPDHQHELNGVTGSAGESEAHNNMPPFIALYYCIKVLD